MTTRERRGVLRLFLISFIPVVLLVVSISWFFLQNDRAAERELLLARRAAQMTMQASLMDSHFDHVIADLAILSDSHELRQLISNDSGNYSAEELVDDFLSFSRRVKEYDQIRLIDNKGMERLRVNHTPTGSAVTPQDELQDKSDREYFKQAIALPSDHLFISSIDLNSERGAIETPFKPMIRLALPLYSGASQVWGIVVINYAADELLKHFLHEDTFGEEWLLNSAGYWLSSPHPEKTWGFMVPERASANLAKEDPTVWKNITANEEGLLTTDEGTYIFATFHFVGAVGSDKPSGFTLAENRVPEPWKVVSFIAANTLAETIDRKLKAKRATLIQLAMALLWLSCIASWFLARAMMRQRVSERNLRVSRETLTTAQEIAHLGSWDWNIEANRVEWSDEAFRIYGYPPGAVKPTYEVFMERVHPDDRKVVEEAVTAAVEGRKTFSLDHRLLHADGRVSTVYAQGKVYRDPRGTPVRMVGTVHDITTMRLAEKNQRLLAERLRDLFEGANDGIFVLRASDGTILEVNKLGAERLGYTEEELVGKPVSVLYASENAEIGKQHMADLMEKGNIVFETSQRRKNGSLMPVEISSRIVDYGGEKVFQSFVRDITDRKRVEAEIVRHHAELERRVDERTAELRKFSWAVEQSPSVLLICDAQGRIEYVNDAFTRSTGYRLDEVKGKTPAFLGSDNLSSADYAHLWQTVLAGGEWHGEFRNTSKSGQKIWQLAAISSLTDENGVITNFISTQENINSLKQTEQKLIESKEAAETANRAKTTFLSSMSHELRTPLNAILGFSQLLVSDRNEPVSDRQRGSLERIMNAGKHLLELIDEVLDLSKIEAGAIPVTLENIDLAAMIDEALAVLSPTADKHSVSLVNAVKGDNGCVWADKTRVRQTLINLISNAIKYNREGGSVILSIEKASPKTVRLTVRDTGQGIAAERLDALFEPFNRLGWEGSDVQGTGIGLTITKRLLEAMGGSIAVSSVEGEGSCFTVDLPLGRRQSAGEEREEPEAICTEQALISVVRQKKILHIENDPTAIQLVAHILNQRPDVVLIGETSGTKGVARARSERPALILLDHDFPDGDIYAIMRDLRSHAETEDIPVVITARNINPGDIEQMEHYGYVRYLTKPINVGELLNVIDASLTMRRPEAP